MRQNIRKICMHKHMDTVLISRIFLFNMDIMIPMKMMNVTMRPMKHGA